MKKALTKGEEQIMQAIWKIDKGFLKDIIDGLPDPKPHSNTVATVLKTLIEKKFVGVEMIGRLNKYYQIVSKEEYSNNYMNTLVKGYFDGSFTNAVSFMVNTNKLSVGDLELLLKEIKKRK